jgi:hypothetical protein
MSSTEAMPAVQVAPAPYVRICLAAAIFGLTEKAIRRKIEDGKWVENREYRRSPDDEIWISVQGVTRWVERATA